MSWRFLYSLDAISILYFMASYYFKCYRKGYCIDFWHIQMFLLCILPNCIMLPFAASELNSAVLQQDTLSVIDVVPQVFIITIFGFAAFCVGGFLWRFKLDIGLRPVLLRAMDIVPRCSRMMMSSRSALVFQSLLCFFLQATILGVYFAHEGFGFDLRGYVFKNTSLRPVALVISNYSVVLGSHSFARYLQHKEKSLLTCISLLSLGLLFFGSRYNIASIFLNVMICYLIQLRTRVHLFKVTCVAIGVVLTLLYLGNVREGEYSPTVFVGALVVLLFYGNNFTDLRDFAWVYSKWDHVYWLGSTYLAASFSFIPRFLSHFRDTWAIGVIVDTTVGLDPEVHPGLRPGAFGEGYFNFGLLGVIAVGVILGVATRRVDTDVKKVLSGSSPSIISAYASTMLLGLAANFSMSGNFSSVYNLICIYVFSWLCILFIKVFNKQSTIPLLQSNERLWTTPEGE